MRMQFFVHQYKGLWPRWLMVPVLAVLLLLSACGGSDSSSAPSEPELAKTTVLVYMVASDLEERHELASANLEEMMQVGSNQNVQIILQTGGARTEGWTTVKRQRVLKGEMEVIQDLGAQRMNAENLRQFIEWGVDAYPAETYHLMFWDHGGGPLGEFGADYAFYPDVSGITMPELTAALQGAHRTTGVVFDLVGFDACLMASAEIAHMLSPYARYMVASEEIEPGEGWAWDGYLQHLADNPDSTAVSAGKTLIDNYIAKMESSYNDMITLSLIDLGNVAPLMNSLNDVAATIVAKLSTSSTTQQYQAWADLAYARRTTHDFQTSWFYNNAFDLVDLEDFITKPILRMLDVTEEQVDAVQKALDEAVVYNRYGQGLWQSSGLTLYSPLVSVKKESDGYPYTDYNKLDVPSDLKALVTRYGDMANSPALPVPTLGPLQFNGSIAYAALGNHDFSAVEFANLWDTTNSAEPRHLAMKPLDEFVAAATPNVAADANGGWFQIPSAEGPSVLVSVLPDDTPRMAVGYAQYTIPVYYTYPNSSSGTKGVLLVDYTETEAGEKTYRITGFLGIYDASPYASRTEPEGLPAGMVFYPLIRGQSEDWIVDQSRKIVSFDVGNQDTPPEDWWKLETVSSSTLCGACGFTFGVVDYKGNMTFEP